MTVIKLPTSQVISIDGMDRTLELLKACEVYGGYDCSASSSIQLQPVELSPYIKVAVKVAQYLRHNEQLVCKMTNLATRKEFSNDPSTAISELSNTFQVTMSSTKRDIQQLKTHSDSSVLVAHKDIHKHYKIILELLTKQMTSQVERFKEALQIHADNVKSRNDRITSRFGKGNEQIKAGIVGLNANGPATYALFSSKQQAQPDSMDPLGHNAGNVRRRNLELTNAKTGAPPSTGLVQEIIQQKEQNTAADYRLQNAKSVEASVAQLGQLFVQMTNLVMAQSDSIARIEDDIEECLENVTQAHSSMEEYAAIMKGNRSMIVKVFLLLILFIFIFLVWT